MTSIIKRQIVEERSHTRPEKNSRRNEPMRPLEVISTDPARLWSQDNKPGRKKLFSREKRQSLSSSSPAIINFPETRRKPWPAGGGPGKEGNDLQINWIDLLFMSNMIMVLVLLALFLGPARGSLSMYIDSRSLYLPPGLYSGAFAVPHDSGIQLSSAAPAVEDLPDVDHSQFDALEVSEYQIQNGDTLGQIALDFDLNMDTLISFNQIRDVRRMQVGQSLQIPNRDGLLHHVEQGDSLSALSDEYGSSLNAILDANSLDSETISPGDTIFIPGVKMNQTDLKLVLGELFIYPASGRFTSGFGYRADPFTGARRFHNGVDWANRVGTPIKASMAGTVVHVESQIGNYGRFVIIQHPRGFQTLYAHMDSIAVSRGEYVSQGEMIGRMGNTGRSTGPHLHFSLIRNGNFVDPLAYLH
ncbi:M23 family metallopeptidase [Salinispira pacifica]|uniref:Peptidase, M23/M37 family n=1 Tax=Salinispira pacifica TaxID=1307761 RepID=V5WGE1_9SPIO|nr:M23 family metallopeptidase [Salinispira pacifica]AHC14614.1 Peptidase, M23/M37 family [Salinispira pacifica]